MKYALIALAALPMTLLAGVEYALEITCLVLMVVGAIWFIDSIEGNVGNDVSDGAV